MDLDHMVAAFAAAATALAAWLLADNTAIPLLDVPGRFAGTGALIGTAIALRRKRTHPDFDQWRLIARWSLLGAATGLAFVLVRAVP